MKNRFRVLLGLSIIWILSINANAQTHIGNVDITGDLTLGKSGNSGTLRLIRGSGHSTGSMGYDGNNENSNLTFINSSGGGYFTFKTNIGGGVNERFRIANNGNVGIGTTNPSRNIHVLAGATTQAAMLRFEQTTGGSYWEQGITNSSSNYNYEIWFNNGSLFRPFKIETATPDNTLYLSDQGNIGIGTANPAAKLHIQNGTTGYTWSSIAGTTAIFEGGTNHRSFISIIGKAVGQSEIHFGDEDSQLAGRIRYEHDVNKMELWTNGVERMAITNSGNVGIGTTSPSEKLDVNGTIKVNRAIKIDGQGSVASVQIMDNTNTATPDILLRGDGGDSYINATNGQLAIGKNTAIATLDVGGNTIIDGNLTIGTSNVATGYKLSVAGKIMAEGVKVQMQGSWPDYVFSKNYQLKSLAETANFIEEEGHLPNIPSAEEVAENGIELGEMNAKLLEKIEELTLHLIEQNNRLESQQKRIEALENKSRK